MFFLRGIGDRRELRICTAHAEHAVDHHVRLTRDGLRPIVTDRNGREMTFAELKREARAEIALAPRH